MKKILNFLLILMVFIVLSSTGENEVINFLAMKLQMAIGG